MARDTSVISEYDLHRFARQLILSGFDDDHQLALLNSHIVVIGAGGLGSPLIQYLAAAGVGALTIFDHDDVDLTNLNRQILHGYQDIGTRKVISAKESVHRLDADLKLNLRDEDFTTDTVFDSATLICDASDNPETRYAANDTAHRHGIPLVFGGAVRLDGQLAVFNSGVDPSAPCYRCIFPEAADTTLVPGCSEAGILGAITGMMGAMMALEAIRHCLISTAVSNPLGPGLGQDLLLVDGRFMTFDRITMKKNKECSSCGPQDG